MEKLISGMHHVALECENEQIYRETVRFYNEVLGLRIVRQWEDDEGTGSMLSAGDALIEIFDHTDHIRGKGSVCHFALQTENVDACVKAVKVAGYKILSIPKNEDIPSEPVYQIRYAFCQGPVGEEIEFFEER